MNKSEDNELDDDDLDELEDDWMDEDDGKDHFLENLTIDADDTADTARSKNPLCMPAKGGAKQHAWGKQRAEGSVEVPAGFEGVTTLGAVIFICAPKTAHLLRLGTPHASAFVVYQAGFAFQSGGKEVKLWRFDEVVSIQTKVEDHITMKKHEYKLVRNSGEAMVLDDSVDSVAAGADQIKLGVYRALLEPMVKRYETGETMTFGPLSVHQQNGLQISGKHYAWDEILNIKPRFGVITVTLNNNKTTKINIAEIPNVELMGRLIGLKQAEVRFALESIV